MCNFSVKTQNKLTNHEAYTIWNIYFFVKFSDTKLNNK